MIKRTLNYGLLFFLIALSASIYKLYLISGQTFSPDFYNTHDQRLFASLANEILKGHWLGTYDRLTLTKPPFYPLWLALIHILHLPLMLANHLLYISACALFVLAIKPLFSNAKLTFIYLLLLFNPYSYDFNYALGFMSESIYPTLTMLVISSAIGLWVRSIQNNKANIPWATFLGFTLAAFWTTRIESPWILPFIFSLIVPLIVLMKGYVREILKIILIPLAICTFLVGSVAYVNRVNYGVFTTCDLDSKEFQTAYGELLRVKQDNFNIDTPLPRKIRLTIIPFSPSLTKIEPYLEELEKNDTYTHQGEIKGPAIVHMLRWSVESAGYYHHYKEAAVFYKNLSDEINTACTSGELRCYERNTGFLPAWQNKYIHIFYQHFKEYLCYVSQFNNLDPWPPQENVDKYSIQLFENLSGPKFIFSHRSGLTLTKISDNDKRKITVLQSIGNIWHQIITPLILLAGIAYILMLCSFLRTKKDTTELIIATSILIALLTRILLTAFSATFLWPLPRHLSAVNPLLLMFIPFVLIMAGKIIYCGIFRQKPQ